MLKYRIKIKIQKKEKYNKRITRIYKIYSSFKLQIEDEILFKTLSSFKRCYILWDKFKIYIKKFVRNFNWSVCGVKLLRFALNLSNKTFSMLLDRAFKLNSLNTDQNLRKGVCLWSCSKIASLKTIKKKKQNVKLVTTKLNVQII